MQFIGEYEHVSEFHRCTGTCKKMWEITYNCVTDNFNYIDVHIMLENIRKEDQAS